MKSRLTFFFPLCLQVVVVWKSYVFGVFGSIYGLAFSEFHKSVYFIID